MEDLNCPEIEKVCLCMFFRKVTDYNLGFHNDKLSQIVVPTMEQGVSMNIPPASELRFPGSLVSLEGVDFSYSKESTAILKGTSLSVFYGDRVGIIGMYCRFSRY